MHPVQLFHWHFMAYPYLPPDFDERFDTGWVTVPNSLWDREKTDGLYQEYIDQLAEAAGLGFDGLVLNEHHQNIYGLMPSPNIIASALTQRTERRRAVCCAGSATAALRRRFGCGAGLGLFGGFGGSRGV